MYFVLIGAGKIGYYLTNLLLEEEHEVVVIDKDEKAAQRIADSFDILSIIGDSMQESTLDKANISQADSVICLTGSDEVNLVSGILAKDMGAKRVAIKLSRVNYDLKFLNKLGVDLAFNPESAAAMYVEQVLTKPDVLDLAFLSRGNAEILEIVVNKDSAYLGKTNKDISEGNLIAVIGKSGLKLPRADTKLSEGDIALILAETDIAKKIRKGV